MMKREGRELWNDLHLKELGAVPRKDGEACRQSGAGSHNAVIAASHSHACPEREPLGLVVVEIHHICRTALLSGCIP